MGQEFHVVRCFSCLTFQSQQVRKDRKFVCKLCGAKQSVKKNYGKGMGKDCRVHVQKLNTLRGNLEIDQEKRLESQLEEYEEDAVSSSGVPSCSPSTFSAASNTDSQLIDGCYIDSKTDKKIIQGEASVASNSVCDSGSKWSNYLTSEADDSDDDIMRGQTSNTSFRISHVTNEAVEDGLDHESLHGIQKRNQQQKNLPKGPMRSHSKKTELLSQSNWCSGPYTGSLVGVTGRRSAVSDKSFKRSSLNDKEYMRQGCLENKSKRSDGEKRQSTNQENSITSRVISSSSSESHLQSKRQFEVANDLTINSKDLNNKRSTNGKLSNTAIFGNSNRNSSKNPEQSSKRQITYTLSSHKLLENPVSSLTGKPKGVLKYGKSQDRILKVSSLTGYPIQEASFKVQKDKSSTIENQSSLQDTLVTKEQNLVDATSCILKKKMKKFFPTNATPPTLKEKSFVPFFNSGGPPKLENPLTNAVNTGKHSATNRITQNSKDSVSLQNRSQVSNILFQGSSTVQGKFNATAIYSKYEAAEDLEDMTYFNL